MSDTVIWDESSKYGSVNITDNGLTVTLSGTTVGIVANKSVGLSKRYFEIESKGSSPFLVGVSNENYDGTNAGFFNSRYAVYGYDGTLREKEKSKQGFGKRIPSGSTIGFLFDGESRRLMFTLDGVLQNEFLDNLEGNSFKPVASYGSSTSSAILSANFGATPFKYNMPEGYSSWDGSQKVSSKYYLIQDQQNDLWTFKDDILTKTNNTLSEETFKNDGFRDYTIINNKTIDKIGLQGIDKGELGSGKYFEIGLNSDVLSFDKIE